MAEVSGWRAVSAHGKQTLLFFSQRSQEEVLTQVYWRPYAPVKCFRNPVKLIKFVNKTSRYLQLGMHLWKHSDPAIKFT